MLQLYFVIVLNSHYLWVWNQAYVSRITHFRVTVEAVQFDPLSLFDLWNEIDDTCKIKNLNCSVQVCSTQLQSTELKSWVRKMQQQCAEVQGVFQPLIGLGFLVVLSYLGAYHNMIHNNVLMRKNAIELPTKTLFLYTSSINQA